DVDPAGPTRALNRGDQIGGVFDAGVSGPGGPADPAGVEPVRRREQLFELGQLALREEREDRAAVVVRDDDDAIEAPTRAPDQRADVVEQRGVAASGGRGGAG